MINPGLVCFWYFLVDTYIRIFSELYHKWRCLICQKAIFLLRVTSSNNSYVYRSRLSTFPWALFYSGDKYFSLSIEVVGYLENTVKFGQFFCWEIICWQQKIFIFAAEITFFRSVLSCNCLARYLFSIEENLHVWYQKNRPCSLARHYLSVGFSSWNYQSPHTHNFVKWPEPAPLFSYLFLILPINRPLSLNL